MSKSLTVDSRTIKFQIWDTAGQERVGLSVHVYVCMFVQWKGHVKILELQNWFTYYVIMVAIHFWTGALWFVFFPCGSMYC